MEKAELEYVRALGQMETKSQSVKGKIGELTAAYTDLRAEYNRMTDAEKSSEFGKALNASLEQMKGRIADNRQEFQNISGEIGNTSGVLDGDLDDFITTYLLYSNGAGDPTLLNG